MLFQGILDIVLTFHFNFYIDLGVVLVASRRSGGKREILITMFSLHSLRPLTTDIAVDDAAALGMIFDLSEASVMLLSCFSEVVRDVSRVRATIALFLIYFYAFTN